MKVDEELIDKLFDGRPVYSERRYEVFHEAASALGIPVLENAGTPFILVKPEEQEETMTKLPKLNYETKKVSAGLRIKIRPL